MARRLDGPTGLGPHFSATFCGGCHEKPTVGGSASRYRNTFVIAESPAHHEVVVAPQFHLGPPHRAQTEMNAPTSVRNPVPLYGLGLLAEVPVEEVLRYSDPHDADQDGISGRANFERGFVGRFGRKAQIASLPGFVRLALIEHLGVTSAPVDVPDLSLAPGPTQLPTADADAISDPEIPDADLQDLVTFVGLLAPLAPAAPTVPIERGRDLFRTCDCAACHVPALRGPRGPIHAYTDLLLHDMGPDLADGVYAGEALPSEFRTQPLWGVAATGPYLHDGRADSLDEAVRWHGGEADAARTCYEDLASDEQIDLLAFLDGLGGERPPNGLLPRDATAPLAGTHGAPRRALSETERARFEQGRVLFGRDFTFQDGLGPQFNGDGCGSCHFDPVLGGAGPSGVDVLHHGLEGGSDGIEPSGPNTVAHRHQKIDARPKFSPESRFERRQTPSLLGLGLVELIPDEVILARADPGDLDGDGVRGRVHRLVDGRIGRFGWKADVATLDDFAQQAFPVELGVTVSSASDGDEHADPELPRALLEDAVFFMRELAPPPRPSQETTLALRGEATFAQVGCATCHVPELKAEGGRAVPLYSDLLLHDIQPEDSAERERGEAGREFRTAPLWGISQTAPYMHDGRASSLGDAILSHHGEARGSRDAYERLGASQQADLIEFLHSL